MKYGLMRFNKYYDALRTNKPFLKTNTKQKLKILNNIMKYFNAYSKKELILKNKPVTAQIEPTSCCNLKCEMCIRDKIGVPIGTMKFQEFRKILSKLDSLFKIHLQGQGESFLNKDLFKMIKYANSRGILVNLNTNGTVMDKDIIKNICKVDIGEIVISIDSTKKQAYEKIRKGSNFDKVIENVKNLIFELKKKSKKTIVSITAVILEDNVDEILDFISLAKKVGVKKILFQSVQGKDDYVERYDKKVKSQVTDKLKQKLDKKIQIAKKQADKQKIVLIFDEEKSLGCVWPWRSIYVTWNGYVTACCKILDYRKPNLGNLLKQDFWEIWNNKEYQKFRRFLRNREAPLACKGCNMV